MSRFAVLGVFLFVASMAYSLPSAPSTDEIALLSDLGLEQIRGAPNLIDFNLEDLTGKKVKLSSFQGKVVLLNFWATWCPPCRQEMPSMEKLYQSLKNNPNFVMLAVDSQEDPATVKAFIQKNGYHFPVLLDHGATATMQYSVRAFPTTYVIDRQGRVIGGIVGAHEWTSQITLKALQKMTQLR